MHTLELNATFRLAANLNSKKPRDKAETRQHFQNGECKFGRDCETPHTCVICKTEKHCAQDSPELHTARGKIMPKAFLETRH